MEIEDAIVVPGQDLIKGKVLVDNSKSGFVCEEIKLRLKRVITYEGKDLSTSTVDYLDEVKVYGPDARQKDFEVVFQLAVMSRRLMPCF